MPILRSTVMTGCIMLISGCAPRFSDVDLNSRTTLEDVPVRLRDDAIRLAQPTDSARREALLAVLRERGIEFELLPFEARTRRDSVLHRGQNVVATIGTGARQIVVGAHYDAERHEGVLLPGMIDNASAAVILARVAETLRRRPLRHSVIVVWFDLEELGLLGSQQYAAGLDTSKVSAMVNVDVTGYGDAIIYGPATRPGNAGVYTAMRRTCADNGFYCVEFPEYPPSDDRSFQAVGVPNISIATLPRVEAHQLWLMMNGGTASGLREGFVPGVERIIHTDQDTPARLEENAMGLAYRAILALVLRLDAQVSAIR